MIRKELVVPGMVYIRKDFDKDPRKVVSIEGNIVRYMGWNPVLRKWEDYLGGDFLHGFPLSTESFILQTSGEFTESIDSHEIF